MSVDPTQLAAEMSVDHSDDFRTVASCSPSKPPTNPSDSHTVAMKTPPSNPNDTMAIPTSSISSSKDAVIVQFNPSSFAQSLLPQIHLFGVTDRCIQQLSLQTQWSWSTICHNDEDVEDASYVLLDNHTKLLRCGGIYGDKYVSSTSICCLDLPSHHHKKNDDIDDNAMTQNMEWISLPKMHYRRHGHRTLCMEISNETYVISMGGFDSKGNIVKKSEVLSVEHIRQQTKLDQKPKKQKQKHNIQETDVEEQKNQSWDMSQNIATLPKGVADFAVCADDMHHRLYICGGLDAQFRSTTTAMCFDAASNQWLNLPPLNCARHCNRSQLLWNTTNADPNILLTFGGWTGVTKTSIEMIDLRSHANKWEICANACNYPHAECASTVKRNMDNIHVGNSNNIEQKLNTLSIGQAAPEHTVDENVVIVCGHKQGLFVETNVVEAMELRTKKWQTIATFKYSQNHKLNQTSPTNDNQSPINLNDLAKHHRYSHAFRYLTLL